MANGKNRASTSLLPKTFWLAAPKYEDHQNEMEIIYNHIFPHLKDKSVSKEDLFAAIWDRVSILQPTDQFDIIPYGPKDLKDLNKLLERLDNSLAKIDVYTQSELKVFYQERVALSLLPETIDFEFGLPIIEEGNIVSIIEHIRQQNLQLRELLAPIAKFKRKKRPRDERLSYADIGLLNLYKNLTGKRFNKNNHGAKFLSLCMQLVPGRSGSLSASNKRIIKKSRLKT